MARRTFNVTDQWQIASTRSALFEIVKEVQEPGEALLFNDTANEDAAERIEHGNKGLTILQPLIQKTYVKSVKSACAKLVITESSEASNSSTSILSLVPSATALINRPASATVIGVVVNESVPAAVLAY